MPMYDKRCNKCEEVHIDCWEPINTPLVSCSCGGDLERVWLSSSPSVIPDDIPGGIMIKHGICNEDGSPRKFYSKSEMIKEAKRKGWTNHVEHVTDPRSGSDKSKYTTRWV